MSNPDQSPALSLEEFTHWLNDLRMMDVSMAFGEIVDRYREATEAAAMAATVPAEPVYWEFRWKDTHPQTVTSGQWYPWEKVEPRNGRLETVESRLAELRDYIAQGKCYELRALYAAQPQPQPATPAPVAPTEWGISPFLSRATPVPTRPWFERIWKEVNLNDMPYSGSSLLRFAHAVFDAASRTAQPHPQPAQPLTDARIAELHKELCADPGYKTGTWFAYVVRFVERAHGITSPSTPTPPEVAP